MSESKYYTPDQEEFHVGFEFLFGAEMVKETFYCVSQFGFSFDDMPELAKNSKVKHLDREDIESFGFKLEKEASEYLPGDLFNLEVNNPSGEKSILGIYFVYNTNWAVIYWSLGTGGNYMLTTNIPELRTGGDNAFVGKIKNKSEFKRILNQTGVI